MIRSAAVPDGIAVGRQVAWLGQHADAALRLVVAPPGFGKTAVLGAYAGQPPGERRRIVLALDERTSTERFLQSIAAALDCGEPLAADDLARLLGSAAPVELIIDGAHDAPPDVLGLVNGLIAAQPRGVFLIVAARRRDLFDVGGFFARGLIALCDQSELALTAAETRTLFAGHGVAAEPAEIDALVKRCDGWPLAIAGTLRERLRAAQPIDAAYDGWQRRFTLPAIDLVSALLERVPAAENAAARRHFADGGALDQHTLAVLHRAGFFVRFAGGTFTLMRWVDELYPAARLKHDELPVLSFELFGRFTASVNGVPVVWARRRDQHIVKYLLLAADSSATRAELAAVFWPHAARPLAMQNLRTACSTIRRAIGNAVGAENVDRYLIAGERLVLNRAATVCDVDRFRRHIALAEADDAAGSVNAAVIQLRAAERLYRGGLFAGGVSEAVFADAAAAFAADYGQVLARLTSALIECGSPDLARDFAAKALKFGFFSGAPNRPQVHLRFAAS